MNSPSNGGLNILSGTLSKSALLTDSSQRLRSYEGPTETVGDTHLRGRCFTQRTEAGLIGGDDLNVMFTIDRPVKAVWPYFKDFNLWQKGVYYSGVVGDMEGQPLRASLKPNDPGPNQYLVLRVVPEYLIVIDQPVQEAYAGLPGLGGVSPGVHVFMLSEQNARTVVTVVSNHASLMQLASEAPALTEEEALRPWREVLQEGIRKWRDDFIPTLKRLVAEG